MPLLHKFLLVGLAACFCPLPSLAVEVSSTKIASHEKINQVAHNANADLVVIAYNSNEERTGNLIKNSMYASVNEERKTKINIKLTTVGDGQALWKKDSEGVIRGWIFRLRLTIKEVMNEYKRRNEEDFVVLLADALDVYAIKSSHANTLESMLHRFVTDFSEHKIVFASQIYCCNPWDLRSVARRDWDDFFASQVNAGFAPPSVYKHLNAGLIIGYASAILEMADEMQLWSKTYYSHENFHSLTMSDDFQHLHMSAIDVDDDEWQLAAWFFEDQAKLRPLATLDYNQGLFAVTGTFRAQHREHGFLVFSHADFESMFGDFPLGQMAFEDLTVCPYSYDASTGSWVNVLTGTKPLLFHFAGNDWLCACEIFRAESYENVPHKFRKNCEENYERWRCRVWEGIQQVALSIDPNEQVFLMDDAGESDLRVHNGEIEQADLKRFHLDAETTQRMLQADPYNSSTPAKTVLAAFLALVSSAIIFCL